MAPVERKTARACQASKLQRAPGRMGLGGAMQGRRWQRRLLAAGLLVPVVVLGGCAQWRSKPSCTAMGCFNGVAFHVRRGVLPVEGPPAARTITACLDGACSTLRLANSVRRCGGGDLQCLGDGILLDKHAEDGAVHQVRFTVTDAAGRVLAHVEREVRFTESFPNGRDCPPPCWQARVDVS
jgi:hypothetical protein